MRQREFDIILYGATGFTGRQAVRYLQEHAPDGLLWAVSGRNQQKLDALHASVPVILCDSTNRKEAEAIASRTHVLISTAGPFELYSDALVAACVDCRTHYVDITGEVVWVRSLIDRFHARAEATGTRIVPFCGFDSVPSDIGVYLLRKKLGPHLREVKAYFQVRGGRPNGGTIASANRTYSSGANTLGEDPFLLTPGFSRPLQRIEKEPTRALWDKDVRGWVAPFPMSIIDSRVVRRSSALSGTDLAYQEYLVFHGRWAPVWAVLASAGTAFFYGVLRSPLTRNLAYRSFKAGSGPSEEVMDNGLFRCRLWGRTTAGETGEVSLSGKGDPANRITVLCLCESALAIASDSEELPRRGGVLTPSTGIGDALVTSLRHGGMMLA